MDPNYENYPTLAMVRQLWVIGDDSILRHASGEPVTIRNYSRSQTVIVHGRHKLSPAIIAWLIRHGDFPKNRIFSLNADNMDLRASNWKEEQVGLPDALNAETLRSAIRYEPETGHFFWISREPQNINDRTSIRSNSGKRIDGWTSPGGYLSFKVFGVIRKAHQWAWLYMTGSLPGEGFSIDHKNRSKQDNQFDNLRVVTIAENNLNKPSVKRISTRAKPRIRRTDYPSYQTVRKCLTYNEKSGELVWLPRSGRDRQTKRFNNLYAGKRAGRYTGNHVILIRLDGKRFLAQEILWIYLGLGAPSQRLVCVNGDQQDLSIENWRLHDINRKPFEMLSTLEKWQRLENILIYHPESGKFFHRQRVGSQIGNRAFNARKADLEAGYACNGYWRITIDGVDYQSSHLAILWLRNLWAPDTGLVVDHWNGNPLDNRAANLRLVDSSKNSRNRRISSRNKSTYSGVMKDSQSPAKWRAYICVNSQKRTIGLFDSFDDAKTARIAAEAAAESIEIEILQNLIGPNP